MTDTPQTGAPERIWAQDHKLDCPEDKTWWPHDDLGGVEYVRADALDASDAVIAALVEALEVVADGHPKDYTDNDMIARAALSKAREHREGKP